MFPEEIPANALMVWEFNGKNNDWMQPSGMRLGAAALDTILKNDDQPVYIANIVFTGPEKQLHPNLATIHLFNDSNDDFNIEDVIFWLPSKNGTWHFLYADEPVTSMVCMPTGGELKSRKKSIVQMSSEKFKLGYAAIQVRLVNQMGIRQEIWAYTKIKKESFDISSGWSNTSLNGKPSFQDETFLKMLKSLYINTAHYHGQQGYSDNNEIYSNYPIKYFGSLVPWELYDKDSLLPRIHGIEILGEPQYGGGTPVDPQKVNMDLAKFAPSRIPTTLTHSEERIWRFYAGLSDYPHYDAYRVSAPSADKWDAYDRWNGKKIAWGAPLETIGTMTRSLKHLNRPASIAYWSQGPHDGWEVYDGRKLTSPTPSELRMQAYHALSTGITSLYWFNLSYSALMKYPDLLEPMKRIGREIRLLDSFYIHGAQWVYERQGENKNPSWDLSTLVAPHGILLFALDLDYEIDKKSKTFLFTPHKKSSLKFQVPEWVDANWLLFRIGTNGPTDILYEMIRDNRIIINDRITEVGIYVLVPSLSAGEELKKKWQHLIGQ